MVRLMTAPFENPIDKEPYLQNNHSHSTLFASLGYEKEFLGDRNDWAIANGDCRLWHSKVNR